MKIFEGAKYQNAVWNYWLLIQLNNGQIVQIFDKHCFSTNLVEGMYYKVSLSSYSVYKNLTMDAMTIFGDIVEYGNRKKFINKSIEISIRDSEEINECTSSFFSIGRIDLENIIAAEKE